MIKITLITVSYNSEETIRETFESVRDQIIDGFDLEYIHVDGLSKDSTIDISMEFDDIITQRVSEQDTGIYNAMNKGIRMATGDVIGFLNSDDVFYDRNTLSEIAKKFSEISDLGIVYGDVNYVKHTGEIHRRWKTGVKRSFSLGWHPAHPAFYASKSLYDNHGGFDESFPIAADFDIMLRFMEKYNYNYYYINKPFVDMKIGGESNGSFKNILRSNREIRQIFIKNELEPFLFYTMKRWLRKIMQRFFYV